MDVPSPARAFWQRSMADDLHSPRRQEPGLLGSLARGEGSDSSDSNLLVELASKILGAYMDVKLFLETVLDRKVELCFNKTSKKWDDLRSVRYA